MVAKYYVNIIKLGLIGIRKIFFLFVMLTQEMYTSCKIMLLNLNKSFIIVSSSLNINVDFYSLRDTCIKMLFFKILYGFIFLENLLFIYISS